MSLYVYPQPALDHGEFHEQYQKACTADVGASIILFEQGLYTWMDRHTNDENDCKPYSGGLWSAIPVYSEESSGTFYYWQLNSDADFSVIIPSNYFEGVMSSTVVSLAASAAIANQLCWRFHEKGREDLVTYWSNAFYAIKEYAWEVLSEEDSSLFNSVLD